MMAEKHELNFQPGLIVNQEFFDYPAMQESSKNWLYLAKYRFGSGKFYGCHDGIQLHNLQIGHADRHEGMFFHGLSPKNCLTIAVLQENYGHLCINDHKMKIGDIIIIDDTKSYEFSSSHRTLIAIISLNKKLLSQDNLSLLNSTDKKFKDIDNQLSDMIETQWNYVLKNPQISSDNDKMQAMEETIISTVKNIFKDQHGEKSNLTKGEESALKVKSFLLESLDETMSIETITKEFDISYRTLENSFNSLFGITPKQFLTLLRLNHAHEDLLAVNDDTNISEIALKWGFSNFGRFSKKYKTLFTHLPSHTLSKQK